jgi:[methyl-Co(III) methanol-specific corrinoid protein]:coenzyme M methyltransferase
MPTPRETILQLFNDLHPETPPRFSGLINVTAPGLELAGLQFHETHTDPAKMAAAAISTYQLCGFGAAVVPLDICVEAEALGAPVDFRAGEPRPEFPRTIKPAFESFNAVTVGASHWDAPTNGRIPVVCDALRQLKRDFGAEIVIGAMVPGPFTLLTLVLDVSLVYSNLRKPPAEMHSALAALTDFLLQTACAYRDAGADFVTVHEMGGSPGVIGPARFRELVLPHLQHFFTSLPGPHVLSCCGRTNGAMPLLAESGATALSVDQTNDLAASRAALPGALLFGNLDPVGTLAHGSPAEIQNAVFNAIASGADAIWPGCDLWPQVSVENLKAFME